MAEKSRGIAAEATKERLMRFIRYHKRGDISPPALQHNNHFKLYSACNNSFGVAACIIASGMTIENSMYKTHSTANAMIG